MTLFHSRAVEAHRRARSIVAHVHPRDIDGCNMCVSAQSHSRQCSFISKNSFDSFSHSRRLRNSISHTAQKCNKHFGCLQQYSPIISHTMALSYYSAKCICAINNEPLFHRPHVLSEFLLRIFIAQWILWNARRGFIGIFAVCRIRWLNSRAIQKPISGIRRSQWSRSAFSANATVLHLHILGALHTYSAELFS